MNIRISRNSHEASTGGTVCHLAGGEAYLFLWHATQGVKADYAGSTTRTELLLQLRHNGVGAVLVERDSVTLLADWLNRRRIYYSVCGHEIIVADSLSHFSVRDIDRAALVSLLRYKFIPPPGTGLKGVMKVPAGCQIEVSRDSKGVVREDLYIGTELEREVVHKGDRGIAACLEEVVARIVPDGSCVFLSEGLDSSVLAMVGSWLGLVDVAYTAVSPDAPRRSTREGATKTASHLSLPIQIADVSVTDFARVVDAVLDAVDEPYADIASVPECVLAERAIQSGHHFAVEGEGADSLLAGSYKFVVERYAAWLRPLRVLDGLVNLLPRNRGSRSAAFTMKLSMMLEYLKPRDPYARAFEFLCSRAVPEIRDDQFDAETEERYRALYDLGNDPLNSIAALTLWGVVPYLENRKLEAVERFSGIRVVLPFQEPDFVAYAFSVPGASKVRRGYGKYPLRAAYATQLPRHVRSRKKVNFVMPVVDWMLEERRDVLYGESVLEKRVVESLITQHETGQQDHTALLWGLYCIENWTHRVASSVATAPGGRSEVSLAGPEGGSRDA